MTDNFEDIEHQETVHAEEGAAPAGTRSNLAEAWRTRPIFKLLVVMTVAGAAIALGTTFFSGGTKQEISHLPAPPDVHEAPGGKASPYFIQQTKEAEEQRSKEALKNGTSAMPTPIGNTGDISVTEKADPMNELRSETERLKQQLAEMQRVQAQRETQQAAQQEATRAQQQVQQVAAPPVQKAEQFDPALSQVMQQQMKLLLDSWAPKGIKQVDVSKADTVGAGGGVNGYANGANGANGNSGQDKNLRSGPPIVPAGTVNYGQLLVEANSDAPTPALAQIVSGPLAGARAIGKFVVSKDSSYLILTFTLADLKGKDYKINAVALDPDTTLGGMATETDQRYFTRLVLPAAAAFLQGFGQELGQTPTTASQSASTTLITQASPGLAQGAAQGAAQAAQTAASFFQSQANLTKPLVRIAAGTPIGLFFVESVYDPNALRETNTPSPVFSNGCPPGTAPGYSIAGRVVNLPTGQTNGCYPTNGSGAGVGVTNPVNPFGASAGNTPIGAPVGGDNGASSVPYPNVGAPQTLNRNLGSPFSYGGGGIGGFGGYGH